MATPSFSAGPSSSRVHSSAVHSSSPSATPSLSFRHGMQRAPSDDLTLPPIHSLPIHGSHSRQHSGSYQPPSRHDSPPVQLEGSRKREAPTPAPDVAQDSSFRHKRRRIEDLTEQPASRPVTETSLSNSVSTEPITPMARKGKQAPSNQHLQSQTQTQPQHQQHPQPHQGHHTATLSSMETQRPNAGSGSLRSRPASHEPPAKVEQPSPPAVFVSNAETQSPTTTWQSDASTSFSKKRLSQSGPGSATRKLPPSPLTLRSGHESIHPTIHSAPPIPIPRPGASGSENVGAHWLSDRSRATGNIALPPSNLRAHPIGTSEVPVASIRSSARTKFPAPIPTPSSLRLQHNIPPLPTSTFPTSPFNRTHHGGVPPSPLPQMGTAAAAANDKAKFMAQMSDLFDRAGNNSNYLTTDMAEKRFREMTNSYRNEIQGLRKELAELRQLLVAQQDTKRATTVGSSVPPSNNPTPSVQPEPNSRKATPESREAPIPPPSPSPEDTPLPMTNGKGSPRN